MILLIKQLSRFMVMVMEFWWEDEAHTMMRLDIGLGTTWEEYHGAGRYAP
jgi:hypothetical protein